jgi:hypothetical protein
MRKLALAPVVLFLFACRENPTSPGATQAGVAPLSSATRSNVVDRYSDRYDLPLNWLLTPSEFPCLKEAVQLAGTLEEHVNFVDSPGSIHITIHQSTNNMTATGLTTSDKYAFSGPLTYTASGSIDDGIPLEETFHNINHIVGPGGDSNIYFRTLIHVTRDATGVTKVEVFKDDVLCH